MIDSVSLKLIVKDFVPSDENLMDENLSNAKSMDKYQLVFVKSILYVDFN